MTRIAFLGVAHMHNDQQPEHRLDPSDSIAHQDPPSRRDEPEAPSDSPPEPLFECYEPRSISAILAQRDAIRESLAAEAAAVILDGVEPIELSKIATQTTIPSAIDHNSAHPHHHAHDSARAVSIRVQTITGLGVFMTPGAQFVYALIMLMLLGGLVGLAATMHTPTLVMLSGIAAPIVVPICIWKWIRWLDSCPYYYRLLSSLGEDARNLLNYRLLWKRSGV